MQELFHNERWRNHEEIDWIILGVNGGNWMSSEWWLLLSWNTTLLWSCCLWAAVCDGWSCGVWAAALWWTLACSVSWPRWVQGWKKIVSTDRRRLRAARRRLAQASTLQLHPRLSRQPFCGSVREDNGRHHRGSF